MSIPHPLLEPWAITKEALQLVIAIASRDTYFAEVRERAMMARDGRPLANANDTVEMRGPVALIHVKGPLFRYASAFEDVSAATSYGKLRKGLQSVLESDEAKAIIWVIDSPGGEVNGVAELADAIYAARGKKPMSAYVGGDGASAAYWLASAVGPIYCSPTSGLGSIGAIMALTDDRGKQKQDGVEEIKFVSSVSPNKNPDPKTDDGAAIYQRRVDALGEVFVAAVAKYRGVSAETVIGYGAGDVLIGQAAVTAGLADALGDFESLLAAVTASVMPPATSVAALSPPSSNYSGANQMDLKILARSLGLPEAATDAQIEERAKALASLERDILTTTQAPNVDQAIGKARAALDASGTLAELKAQLDAQQAAARSKELRTVLKDGLKDGRVTLGEIAAVVPTFLKDEEGARIKAELAALPSQEKKAVLGVLASASISDKRLERVRAWVDSKAPQQLPAAHPEPAATAPNQRAVVSVTREQAAAFGISAEAFQRFANIDSVDQLPAPTQKGN